MSHLPNWKNPKGQVSAASSLAVTLLSACIPLLLSVNQAHAQQESPTPSIAEAARASRALQKSAVAKKVVSNEDDPPQGDGKDATVSDEQVRAQLEREWPKVLNAQSAKTIQDNADMIGFGLGRLKGLSNMEDMEGLHDYKEVQFPGRSEWENQFRTVIDHMADDCRRLPDAIHSIIDSNRALIDGGGTSPEAAIRLKQVRSQLIDAMLPCGRWQMTMFQMQQDAVARAKAYLNRDTDARADYGRSRAPAAEEAVAWALTWLDRREEEYRVYYGRYTCDLDDFKFGDKTGPHSAALINANITAYQYYNYQLTLQGCEASQGRHFRVLAAAPDADGTQGRAFCSDDSGFVHRSDDGRTENCFSSPTDMRKPLALPPIRPR